jgi:uncharacterized protein YbaP (TraB family)
MRVPRLLLLVALVASACASSKPACKIGPPVTQDGAFLWRAQKGDAVLWLYGTIHDAGIDAVPAVAQKAFASAARLVTELGEDEPDKDAYRELARMPWGKPGIDQLLPSSDWYDLRDSLIGVIKEEDLKRARPWYAMTLLTTHLDPSRGKSMDVQFAQAAHDRGISIDALESWTEQLGALDKVVDIAALQETIHARHEVACSSQQLRTAYDAGDSTTLEAILVIPQTRDVILTARNTKWLTKLETYQNAFVAVGLGHLLGASGLPAMLQQAGYTVERVAR